MRLLTTLLVSLLAVLNEGYAMEKPPSRRFPDHLESPSPLVSSKNVYWPAIKSLLLTTSGNYGRMIVLPSFSVEMSVSVYQQDNKYFVHTAEAESSIWTYTQKTTIPPNILSWTKQIDRDLAVAVRKAWQTMIAAAKPSDQMYRGCDGTTLLFSVGMGDGREQWAESWSPESAKIRHLQDIGMALGYLAADTKTTKRKSPAEIIQMCNEAIQ